MPAKAPIYLKPNNSKKGKKCRLRDILSPDMISPPLGDFRHTVHIGRGGERDAFGDMSFLQGRFELLPGQAEVVHPQCGTQSDYQRTCSTSDAYFAETPSPVLKNAISLPAMGGGQALTLPLISSSAFPLPPAPLEDILGPTAAMKQDRADALERMQTDALLHSMDVFAEEPTQPSPSMQSKPDVLLDLLGKPSKPASKAVSDATKMKKRDKRSEKPRSFNANNLSKSSYKTNGSLHSDASSDSYESFDGKGNFMGHSHEEEIYNGDGSLNSTGNCDFGPFGNNITMGYEKGPSRFSGDYADRDSGVEEGRVCDFDYEFGKDKRLSRDSLVQITGSMLSLELDLGPSILDEVLNIMDKPSAKSRP
ncbi:cdc42 effector protein 3 [Gadus macrocephalus]|uniref:cdc42 effector protein 3 n=1 Tax=Gadus macrocephalus TaxID=80720 RepID=UPI0028CB7E5E|nr:cdc42 effector protein 3 [Gadus macrocephalus]